MANKHTAAAFTLNAAPLPCMTLQEARHAVAIRAAADGFYQFAGEVMAGCWDHRNDVQAAMAGRPLKPITA